MTKRVEVQVNKDGTFRVEFSGFGGEECIDQADRLRTVLAGLGLMVDPVVVERKDPSVIALELGEEDLEPERVRQRVPRS